jgi:acyl-[acyl carrier protein]--UDP-N-acetylglucosamine O-acyltransferase
LGDRFLHTAAGILVSIHPLANVSPEARLGVGVIVGAFATVEADVELGDHCVVGR